MSFSRLIGTKPIHCIHKHLTNRNNCLSLNIKYFHSVNSLPKTRNINQRWPVKTVMSCRYMSAITTDTTVDFAPQLTENVIDLSSEVDTSALSETLLQVAADGSELPLTALGLASNYTPIGWVLHLLDGLHSVMPWCASIALATLMFRLAMFPVVIKTQKNNMIMQEMMPQLQALQLKQTNARLAGNHLEFAKYSMEMQKLMKSNGYSMFKSTLTPLCQAPVFLTFFLSLRRMAALPVESLKTGGILWFVDLTIPDPYHLLPIITSISLWAALELGAEAGVNPNQSAFLKYFIRVIPAITLAFIWNFESAILMYWCTSNFISLCQVMVLKQPAIRNYLGIPVKIKHKPEDLPITKKGFYASIKESMDNSKVYRKIEDRKRIDEINFKRAAIGPIKKTFKSDPTKVQVKQR